ncbi:MAG: phospho-N-acetylmuramoyl-pentapeptide-transferase [Candidatus Margulisiibacteriota bacterium]
MPIPFLIAYFIGLIINYITLILLKKYQVTQKIREEGPESHRAKQGTPTMGGIGIILAAWLVVFLHQIPSTYNLSLFFLFFGLGLVGISDDLIKIIFKRNEGLKGRQKLFGQVMVAVIFAGGLVAAGHHHDVSPLLRHLGFANPFLYTLFAVLVITGASNAVNLTDGLDGQAGGVSGIIMLTYGFICLKLGLLDAALFCFVLSGVCLSFLFFNFTPAAVFMGDAGALALGGVIGGIALLTHTELPLMIIALIPIVETLSVMIQVTFFKFSKGKRIFKMTPIHHHFELSGWPETKVVFRFWTVSIISGIVGYLLV